MEKIKVLIALNDMNNGGTETFVMNYYRKADRNSFTFSFLIMSGENEYYRNEIEQNGDKIYHLSNDNKKNYFKNCFILLDFFRHNHFDVVHINSCSQKFMAQIAVIAKISGVKRIIGHSHSVGEPKTNILYKIGSYIIKKVINTCIDFACACSMDAALGKYTSKRIYSNSFAILPNAIDINKYSFSKNRRIQLRNDHNWNDFLILGIVGRLDIYKNQSFLLDVVKRINVTTPAKLAIIGDGDMKYELEKKVKSLNINDYVDFLGQLDNAYEFYSAFDVFCLPSYAEGLPFVLVEAQANSLKCFVSEDISNESNISGTVEYLDRHNVELWCNKIIDNMDSRISDRELKKITELYDISNAVMKLEDIYKNSL